MIMTKAANNSRRSGPENRQSERFPCRLETICHLTAAGKKGSFAGRIVDISTGGIGLVLNRAVDPGARITVRLHTSGPPRDLSMQVVHVTELAPGCWLMGGAFTEHFDLQELRALLS
jgi:hypothetical protein